MKRQRGRNRNKSNHNNNSNRSLDSSGPDVKVRGSASTIYEKYVTLARDAASSGNRVKAENYHQHAEHYLRLVNAQEAAKQAAREEAEAARAARGGDNSNDDESGEAKEGSRRNRRYPPRVKRSEDKGTEETKEASSSTSDALDVVTPKADAPKDKAPVEAAGEAPKAEPKRRRKAPSRKKTDDKPVEVDAAE
ncbi:MAG: DUF4167 domain-containing protein [Maricaulaceae bacterium]